MNKSQLVEAIALSADITKAAAVRVIDEFQKEVTGALKKAEPVVLVGFGTFTVKSRASRIGRNPQTGASLQISAAQVPTFKAGKQLKAACN